MHELRGHGYDEHAITIGHEFPMNGHNHIWTCSITNGHVQSQLDMVAGA